MAKEKLLTDDEVTAHISAALKRLLAAKKWSQTELARQMGEPLMTVNTAVNAKHQCRPGFVARAAAVLGVTSDELLGLAEPEEKKSRRTA